MYKHRYSVTCLIVALMCSSVGLGQTNRFVNPDKMWICRWSSTNSQLQAKSFPVKYYFYGDTLISGKECQKLQLEWNDEPVRCIAAFYEEEGKVYYYPSRNSTEPALMYDFTASVGDSLHLSSPGNVGWPDSTENPAIVGGEPGSYDFLVTSVSDTIINMYQLSVTTLENGVTPPVKIINGIGTLSGPLNLVGYSGYSVQLDSCRIGDKTIFSMSPAASKQPHDTLLFCGFEHGESNYVISNTAIRPDGSTDEVRVVTDETGKYHQELLGLLGSDNVDDENNSFLRWKAGDSMYGAGCNPEDASLILDGFNLESGQRYAVDFTFSANVGGNMAIGIYHRTPDGLEPVNGPGISPDGFLDFCYHIDYINRYRVMFMSGSDYEDCCLRFSFLSPGVTYEIDNIALLESVSCDVSYNGDIAKIKFTPGNNLSELASLAPEGAIEIPSDCISLEAEYDGEPYGLDVMTAEYHDDGYLYVWLDDDSFEGLEKISFSFHNPVDDPSIALKYIKDIDTATNDAVWALLPDLIQQRAFHNPEVYVTSHGKISWLVTSNQFDYNHTDAPSDLDSITMTFRSALAPDFEESITAQLVSADGWSYSESWHVSDYIVDVDNDDHETYTVVFRPDSLNNPDNKQLPGKYIFKLGDVRFWSACQHIMTDYSVSVYFGGTNSIGREAEAVSRKEVNRHYGLDGRMIPADSPGVHIIRSADGTIHKVLVPYQSFHPSLQSGRE